MLTSALRGLGAKIGHGTYIDCAESILDFDLLSIGSHCHINASFVIGHVFQYGTLQFNQTTIGDRCNVGVGSQVVPGVVMEGDSSLCAVSRPFNGDVLAPLTVHAGVPSKCITVCTV